MIDPRPQTVRAGASLAILVGVVALVLGLLARSSAGAFMFGVLFVVGGLLLRIEAAILRLAPPGRPGVPDRPWGRDPRGSDAEPPGTDPTD